MSPLFVRQLLKTNWLLSPAGHLIKIRVFRNCWMPLWTICRLQQMFQLSGEQILILEKRKTVMHLMMSLSQLLHLKLRPIRLWENCAISVSIPAKWMPAIRFTTPQKIATNELAVFFKCMQTIARIWIRFMPVILQQQLGLNTRQRAIPYVMKSTQWFWSPWSSRIRLSVLQLNQRQKPVRKK